MILHAHSEVKAVPKSAIPFQFRADPVALDDVKLDPTARAAFVLILDNARSRGWRSRLSNATLGRILGRCPMTISRALGRLESAGLIHRDLAAGGRIRTGIVVTWDGVRRESLTEQASVRREGLTGPTPAPKGVRREHLTNQSSGQNGDQTVPILSTEEDPESVVPDGPTAAAYLRAMIEAGRRGGAEAARPAPPCPAPTPAVEASPPPSVQAPRQTPPAGPSRTPQDDARRVVERMAGSVFQDARRAAWGPLPGGRRLTPAELQRQLAEVRRKYGKDGARNAQPRDGAGRSITDMGGAYSR